MTVSGALQCWRTYESYSGIFSTCNESFRLLGMQSFNYNNRTPKVRLQITKKTPYLYHCENLNLSVPT